jgi:hypothetical protein
MKTVLFGLCLLALASCTRIVFDQPQPAGTDALTAFPERFSGSYVATDGTPGVMVIGRSTVVVPETSSVTLSLDDLAGKPNLTLKDGMIYDSEMPEIGGVPFTIADSTLSYGYVSSYDTLGLSDTLVIKEMGTSLVVSINTGDDDLDYWDVLLLDITSEGELFMTGIANLRTPDSSDDGEHKGNIEDYAGIAPYERLEENTYLFRPNKRQFKKLVEAGLFSEKESIGKKQ